MKKLAVIRDDSNESCPFGLGIPYACKKAGNSINEMLPLFVSENNKNEIKQKNVNIFLLNASGERCLFANKIIENKVNCSFEEQKENRSDIIGSPIYTKMFSGIAGNGLYTLPQTYYAESPLNSGPWYSMYGIESVGAENNANIKKSTNKT